MASEHEIIEQHRASLREARECCLKLRKNAVEPSPRGAVYMDLKAALKRLEGTCRQMGHMRGDARWFRLATVYAGREQTIAASRTGTEARQFASAEVLARRYFLCGEWLAFGGLAQLFALGLRRLDELAERKTERAGTLILPPWMTPQ